eukprot:7122419-Prymnesium_polylepis.2
MQGDLYDACITQRASQKLQRNLGELSASDASGAAAAIVGGGPSYRYASPPLPRPTMFYRMRK